LWCDLKTYFYYLRQGNYVFVVVCLFVSLSEPICIIFSGKVGSGQLNEWLNFGGDLDHRRGTGIVSGFVTIGSFGLTDMPKSAAASSHSFILIRQMAAVVIIKLDDIVLAAACAVR